MKTKKLKRITKVAAMLLTVTLSGQSFTTAFAENSVDASAIDPVKASYGYYVDTYMNNSSSNMTPETNPSIGVLSEFLKLWTPGSAWNNGIELNTAVLEANISKVVTITNFRTASEEKAAYLDDRRNQSYSVINGLGVYTDNFYKAANAGTTISDTIPADAATVKYDDGGNSNGVWADENSSLGAMVMLVDTVRNSSASTSSAKKYYQYKRPFRWIDDVSVASILIPCKSSDPSNDGGFPSGHTNAGYLTALSLAYAVPERFQEMLTRASELGNNRIVAGMHSPLDVIGGRIMATAIVASVLNDPNNSELKQEAYLQAQNVLLTQEGTSEDKYSDYNTNLENYTYRLTYGFKQIGDTTKPMVVPKGAEVLLETRLPYLDTAQRRWVIYSTGLPSGYPVLDDAEGWGRLNLFAAANGYGAFDNDVTVVMDASKGGYHALDNWKNDISGAGALIKQGTGTLILSGNNTYTGGTVLEEGSLEADSSTAFGTGDVVNNSGTIVENVSDGLTINGDFTQESDGTLVLNIDSSEDILTITGQAAFDGSLKLNFAEGYVPSNDTEVISYASLAADTAFSSVEINGLSESYTAQVVDGAVVVTDASKASENTDETASDTAAASENSDTTASSAAADSSIPKTGETSTEVINFAMILLCLTGVIMIYRKNRNNRTIL
ncbi:MAG TPA: phosphatase PAP2 family protein [Mobilitalea sp.]|nr:phosphatase PAP2 family protein [Mobilitalea sp.]